MYHLKSYIDTKYLFSSNDFTIQTELKTAYQEVQYHLVQLSEKNNILFKGNNLSNTKSYIIFNAYFAEFMVSLRKT